MTANRLLMWMSARREGSWQQFRSAVEELHLGGSDGAEDEDDDVRAVPGFGLYRELRFNLQRVGHAEFYSGKSETADWRVTPPTIAVTQCAEGFLGIVAGARSQKRLQELTAAGAPVGLKSHVIPGYPDQYMITAAAEATIALLASQSGYLLQSNAPAAILACLPPIDDPHVRHAVPLPFGKDWQVHRFALSTLTWRPAKPGEASRSSGGLFRFVLNHQRHVLYCAGGTFARIPAQVGKYLILKKARRRLLSYDGGTGVLTIPASCRPPFLIERALVLCSGFPPTLNRSTGVAVLQYGNVPRAIASRAAELLRQRLQ